MKPNFRNDLTWIGLGGIVLLGLIALGRVGAFAPLAILRALLGLIYVLIVPGYTMQAALFAHRDDLDGPERFALSFGLSICLIAPLALALDNLPWGIRLWPIALSEALVIALFALLAWRRRQRIPEETRYQPELRPLWRQPYRQELKLRIVDWWGAQDRTRRTLYRVLGAALAVAALCFLAIVALPHPGDRFTEFYILGYGGLAEDYPREGWVGRPLTVTMGITNLEARASEYRVEVRNGETAIGEAGPIHLKRGATDEREIAFTPTEPGDDVQVQFLLYRDGETQPYRSLRLWLKVRETK